MTLIHSKPKITSSQIGTNTQIHFIDRQIQPSRSSLLFPSGRRTRLQQFTSFYSLLESHPQPLYITHFRQIQMNIDTTRCLLHVILFVQEQPSLIVKTSGRYMTIQLAQPNATSVEKNLLREVYDRTPE